MADEITRITWVLDVADKATGPYLAADRKIRSAQSAMDHALKQSGNVAAASSKKVGAGATAQATAMTKAERAAKAQSSVVRALAAAERDLGRAFDASTRDAKQSVAANDKVTASLRRSSRAASSASRSTPKRSVGLGPVAGLVGGAAVAAQAKTAITAAIAVGESLSKNEVLFGRSAASVDRFAKSAAKGFGTSREAALQFTGVYGNLLRAQGISEKTAAKTSVAYTKLAADLASFNNTSVEQAAEALKSGLTGESEPLRAYGVQLSETRIKAEALAQGLIKPVANIDKVKTAQITAMRAQEAYTAAVGKYGVSSQQATIAGKQREVTESKLAAAMKGSVGDLNAQQKLLATQAVIYKDTAKAQGDFGRTSGGLANQQKIIAAEFANARTELATKLLPSLTDGAGALIKFIDQMKSGKGAGGAFADVMGDMAEGAKDAVNAVKPIAKGITDFAGKHPGVAKLAGGIVAFGLAVKAIRFAGAISGLNTLLRVAGRVGAGPGAAIGTRLAGGIRTAFAAARDSLASRFSRTLSSAGRSAGSAGADSAATSMANTLRNGTNNSKFRLSGRVSGGIFGRALLAGGLTAMVGIGALFAAEIEKGFTNAVNKVTGGSSSGGGSNRPGYRPGIGPTIDAIKGLFGGRTGGRMSAGGFRRFQEGGLVPALVSPGEEIHYQGRVGVVPGAPVAADSVFMPLPVGAAVVTGHGQGMMAHGASLADAIAGQMPHFRKGGVLGAGQIATLASRARFGRQSAVAGAVGKAESGGDPTAHNTRGEDSRGLMQINVGPGANTQYRSRNLFDPQTNLRTAKEIYNQRNNFQPWTMFRNGEYRKHLAAAMKGGNPGDTGSTGSTGSASAVAKRVAIMLGKSRTRAGLLTDAVQQGVAAGAAGVSRAEIAAAARGVRGARANPIIEAIRGAQTATSREVQTRSSSSSRSSSSRSSTPSRSGGVGNIDGVQVAKWIIPILQQARKDGVSFRVSSGFRSFTKQTELWNRLGRNPQIVARPGTSNHEGSKYPRGAVDLSAPGWQNMAAYLRRHQSIPLKHYQEAKDPFHFSATGHRRGGLIRRFAAGGTIGGAGQYAQPGYTPPRSSGALKAALAGGTLEKLDAIIGAATAGKLEALRKLIARRVQGPGTKKAIQRLQSALDLIDGEIGRRIGVLHAAIERGTALIGRRQGELDRTLRFLGVDAGSSAGLQAAFTLEGTNQGTLNANRRRAADALARAKKTGSREVIQQAQDALDSANDALAESFVRRIELIRDTFKAFAQERVDTAQFGVDSANAGIAFGDSLRRLTGTENTPEGLAQKAAQITSSLIPALAATRDAFYAQAQVALTTGDLGGWRQAMLAASAATTDLANSTADAAESLKLAAEAGVNARLGSATFASSFAQGSFDLFENDQRLAGSFDTGGAARAAYITSTILPTLRAVVEADQAAIETARTQRGVESQEYRDAVLKLLADQKAVQDAQLQAEEQIKVNTDTLRDFAGSSAFEYNGNRFVDDLTSTSAGW